MIKTKHKKELLRPIKDLVKVRIIVPQELRTDSGIIIPQQSREQVFKGINYYQAEILEFSGTIEVPRIIEAGLKVGDVVLTDVFAGTTIPTKGDQMIKMVDFSMLFAKKINGFQTLKPTQLEALSERVLVKIIKEKEEKTESGIILPDGDGSSVFDNLVITGEILSLSADVEGVKVGDHVCFEQEMGIPLKFPGDTEEAEYRMLVKYDLLCKVDPE